ncbi:hypothetical protein VE03_00892 [Pseudogymnoascus sp. 23342-1-I1]|nr:hypothetical protein VE03_00892 [Pseudogymnoascus sp. 23342-1-I1]
MLRDSHDRHKTDLGTWLGQESVGFGRHVQNSRPSQCMRTQDGSQYQKRRFGVGGVTMFISKDRWFELRLDSTKSTEAKWSGREGLLRVDSSEYAEIIGDRGKKRQDGPTTTPAMKSWKRTTPNLKKILKQKEYSRRLYERSPFGNATAQ